VIVGPLVSVVLPTHDRPGTLPVAVRSVLKQTHGRLELIVVDDGSERPAASLLGSDLMDDGRLRVLRVDSAGGAARARNLGLARAQGEFVAFLDDDDEWLPDKLASQLSYFRDHPGCGLVSCDYLIRGPRRPLTRFRGPSRFTAAQTQWMNLPGSFSFVMARPEVLGGELVLDPTFPSVEDWDLWLRCHRRAPVGIINRPLVVHTLHGGLSKPESERRGLERFIAKHGDGLPPECLLYLRAHLRMLSGQRWGHRRAVARAMLTPSPAVSILLVLEQAWEQMGARRQDPGLVLRMMVGRIGPEGRLGGRPRTEGP
jgi:GT2 family glycosyltransferase